MTPLLPSPRGPLSEHLFEHLLAEPHRLPSLPPVGDDDPLQGDDLQLALYCCYELHYQGFGGVDDRWEWEPSLLGWRRQLERAVEERLAVEVGSAAEEVRDVGAAIRSAIDACEGPSLSGYMLGEGALEQMQEYRLIRLSRWRAEVEVVASGPGREKAASPAPSR